jgi:hypothetical protein
MNKYLISLIPVGYGREGNGNDTETLASEKANVNFELLQILVN